MWAGGVLGGLMAADSEGVVVCSLDTHEFTAQYPEEHWAFLRDGVLILSDEIGLAHYRSPEPTFRLLRRSAGGEGDG